MGVPEENRSYQMLLEELEETRLKLEEANDTINAIKSGDIDALVVKNDTGHQVYTLKSADQTYRIFIEQMTEGAVTLNQYGNVIYSNSQFARLVSLPLEKVIGQPFCSFINSSDIFNCEETLQQAWDTEIKIEVELVSDAKVVPVLLSFKTLDLEESTSMSVIISDLSSQKEIHRILVQKHQDLEEAQITTKFLNENLETTVNERTSELKLTIQQKTMVENNLRSYQEQLSRILETMAEGVIIGDRAGNLTYANPLGQRLLNLKYEPEAKAYLLHPDWKYLKLDGTELSGEQWPMHITMAHGQPVYDFEIAIQPAGKEVFYISVNTAALRTDEGIIIGAVSTFMDVTSRRKALQNKDDFISVASHELRTPVTTLKASLQLLDRIKNNPSSPAFPKLIDQANKSLTKMSVLIEDLLNATKMTDGQLTLKKKSVALTSLIEECIQAITITGSHKIVIDRPVDVHLYADPHKIAQVMDNFLNNALKYAGNSEEILIRVEKMDTVMIKISVIDNGPGIDSEKIPYLFDRYYRVEGDGFQYSGLGLGLYICSQIIKKHGGQIGAESIPGTGSTFWFTLPLA